MKIIGILLVLGIVGVYFYVQQIDRSGGDESTRGHKIVPVLGGTILVLGAYILFTSLQK